MGDRPCLLAVAAPREVEAVLRGLGAAQPETFEPWAPFACTPRLHLVCTGVGKANAAGAVARALGTHSFAAVVSLGLAGALPHERPLTVGQTLLADPCILADEGLGTDRGFLTQSSLGFPAHEALGERFPSAPALRAALAGLADRIGPCATVSTCSGSDARAHAVSGRTAAIAEDMESAAVGLAAARFGVPFASLRVVSNRTGARAQQGWDLDTAFSVLTRLASAL